MYIDISRRKDNGLPLLYKNDIEQISKLYLEDFNSKILEEPVPTPIEEFLENYLGLDPDYADITPDGSVLGLTTFDSGNLTVYDLENNRYRDISVERGTVIIDNTLVSGDQEGRFRFTCGHECGHWILHRDMFKSDENQLNIFDMLNNKEAKSIKCLKRNFEKYSSKRTLETDNDWMEWQANFISSCFVMPKDTFIMASLNIFRKVGIYTDYIVLGQDFDTYEFADDMSRRLSKIFNVSIQAASIRLRQLKLIREETAQLGYY
ncbi:ImmA/IrrE family metallo-endopeptidase [Clostridium tyrobutyricum]|uniref:ImmA/IrrE family metallo-endopeptidase n=1 Tax=Clostridium tyrobutyricum TaxID=1519 RepID=UPI00189E174A